MTSFPGDYLSARNSTGPDIGHVAFAGWVSGDQQLPAVCEMKVDGRYQRRFEVLRLDTLAVQKQAANPEALSTFYRWQDAGWKSRTVSIR